MACDKQHRMRLPMISASSHSSQPFFGPWVIRSAFVLAVFGWGMGFYGPAIYLHAVMQRTGWALTLVSAALTVHYLFGALVVTQLPRLHRRFGVGRTAVTGAIVTALGVCGWSLVTAPWQLFVCALLSGGGWVTMGAVALNAAIAPWYVAQRPMALAKAYNGASIGGVVFSPLWVLLIDQLGFTAASAAIGLVMVLVVLFLSHRVLSKSPGELGQYPDGAATEGPSAGAVAGSTRNVQGAALWRDRRFLTLALGMALGLFAQIGLLAHLYSLLVPGMGTQFAGITMGFATACGMGGRLLLARVLPAGGDRRVAAALMYGVQLSGVLLLCLAGGQQTVLIVLAVALFGAGIGNATSLPPLIVQSEFAKDQVQRVVALIVAMAQATYAFAPAVFGAVLVWSGGGAARIGAGSSVFLLAIVLVQVAAIASFLAGRTRH